MMTETLNMDNGFCIFDESKRLDGDCIRVNGQAYLDFVDKYGRDNFELISYCSRKDFSNDYTKEFDKKFKSNAFKNYSFHLMIKDKKNNRIIDKAIGRKMVMDYDEWVSVVKYYGKKNSKVKPFIINDMEEVFWIAEGEKCKIKGGADISRIDILCYLVGLKWNKVDEENKIR